MKRLFYILGVSTAAFMMACGTASDEKTAQTTDAGTAAEAAQGATAFTVDTASSVSEWKATKKVGGHNGTVKFNAGTLNVENGNITAGKFAIDLASIKCADLTDTKMNGDLVGHLKSPDFFDVAKFPTANFEITKVEAVTGTPDVTHNITGNLTIRGITKGITIPAKVEVKDKQMTATSTFKFNRLDFDMKYHSTEDKTFDLKKMGDNLINNDVELKLVLNAKG